MVGSLCTRHFSAVLLPRQRGWADKVAFSLDVSQGAWSQHSKAIHFENHLDYESEPR